MHEEDICVWIQKNHYLGQENGSHCSSVPLGSIDWDLCKLVLRGQMLSRSEPHLQGIYEPEEGVTLTHIIL